MTSEYFGYTDMVITPKQLQQLGLASYRNLLDYLEEQSIALEVLAMVLTYGLEQVEELAYYSPTVVKQAITYYEQFRYYFHQQTNIRISLAYRETLSESVLEEHPYAYFCLEKEDIFQYTPQAKQLLENGVLFEPHTFIFQE